MDAERDERQARRSTVAYPPPLAPPRTGGVCMPPPPHHTPQWCAICASWPSCSSPLLHLLAKADGGDRMETDGGDRMARAYGPPSQGKLPLSLVSLSRASLLPPKASWLSRLSLARKASSEASCIYLLPLQAASTYCRCSCIYLLPPPFYLGRM